jgi:hypothetical protein
MERRVFCGDRLTIWNRSVSRQAAKDKVFGETGAGGAPLETSADSETREAMPSRETFPFARTTGDKRFPEAMRSLRSPAASPCSPNLPEPGVSREADAGPKDLRNADGPAKRNPEQGRATEGVGDGPPAPLLRPQVHRDGKRQQIKPHGEKPDVGCG